MTSPIVLRICEECGISPDGFFSTSRAKKFVFARRAAIEKMREAGLTYGTIARLIKRNISTVEYWLLPVYRHRRSKYYIRRNATKPTDDPGIEIVRAVMLEFQIGRKDLAKTRLKHCVEVRVIAIRRLSELGLNYSHIGRLIGCDRATVRYWLKPESRKKKLARHNRPPPNEHKWERAIECGSIVA